MSLYNFPSPEWECNIWMWWDITLMSRFTLYHKGKGISQVWFRTLTSWPEVNQKEEHAWHNQVGSLKKRSRGQSQEVREMWTTSDVALLASKKQTVLLWKWPQGRKWWATSSCWECPWLTARKWGPQFIQSQGTDFCQQAHGTEPWALIVCYTLSRDFIQAETRHPTHGTATNEWMGVILSHWVCGIST